MNMSIKLKIVGRKCQMLVFSIPLLICLVACDNPHSENIENRDDEKKDTIVYDYENMVAKATITIQESSSEGLSAFLIMGVSEDARHYQMTMWNYGSRDTILWVGDYMTTGGRRCLYDDGGSVCPFLTRYTDAVLKLQNVLLVFDENDDKTYHAELTCTLPSGETHHLYAPIVLRRGKGATDLPYPQQ